MAAIARAAGASGPDRLGGAATSWRSQRSTLRLTGDAAARVAALARETGCTPYMVLLAVFGALIHRYTHADDFLVAAPVLNRDAGAEEVIGYHGNTVAMRLRPRRGDDIPRTAGADA